MRASSQAKTPDTQLFRDVFNAIPIGIAVENLEGQPLFVNPAFCSFLGFTQEELCTKHCVDFSPPEDAEKDWALFQQLRAGSINHYQLEKRYFRRDGALVWGRLSISLLNSHPSPLVVAMVEDITEKKTAEEARFRHAAIVESSEDAIASVNLDGLTVTWNAGAQRMFGYTENETVGKPASIIVPPELRDQQKELLETLRAGGRIEQFETVRVSKAGKPIDVSLSISPIKDSTGKIVGCAGAARDITTRKRAEEALLSSEQRYRLLFERNVAGVAIATLEGQLLDCNDGWAHILGYESKDELLGRHASEFYFNPAERKPLVDELFEKRVLFSRELQLRRKDGTPVWVLFNSAVHSDHDRPIVQATMIDISEWKRAEEARFRHAALVESSEDAIISKNLEGVITGWNAAAQKIFGYTESEAVGQPITILIPPYLQHEEKKILERLKAGERIEHYETIRVTKAGKTVDVSLSISPIKDSSGKVVGASKIARDISERKKDEEALRISEERLRFAYQAARIGTFEWNIRTGVNTWTPELEGLYGLPPGAFAGTQAAFMNLVHSDDREGVLKLFDESLKTGQTTRGEWRVVWPDGSVHWIAGRWQVFMNESGEPARVIGVNGDFSERKRAEEALLEMNRTLEAQGSLLRSREELLRIFVKNVPAAVAMLDRDMRYLQVSDRWCTDYLPGRAQILGRSHYEIFPDMPERWKEVHRRALEGETLRADEDRWDGQDGTHWARWEVRPWKTPEGAVGGILILAEDISRRKQMEETLSDLSRKLIESQEQERTRIGRELHDDINQRLAMLAIELEQLQENPTEVSNRVQELRERAVEISNDVQALSHELHSSKLEYLGVVAGIKSWCKEFGDRQRMEIDFKNDVSSALPFEIGLSLFRIIQEALHNAQKHSGVKRIEVQLAEHLNEVDLTVSDSGKGFDIETAKRSAGLGLTSMRERARLVNGTISIESKPMGGTTIHVRVPLGSENFCAPAVG